MTKILTTFAALFVIVAGIFFACKKTSRTTPTPANQPPIARAGADVLVTLAYCPQFIYVDLDGSGSTDPDGGFLTYAWRKISGPPATLLNPTSARAKVVNIGAGDYAFELSVTDVNAVSKDTMVISIKPASPKEYDLDITITDTFSFSNNYKDCYYTPCTYHDITQITGKATFAPIGEFSVVMSEYADTAASQYAISSHVYIYSRTMSGTSIYGTSSVNLKKLIQQGGGPFNGTCTVTGGSSNSCLPNVLNSLPPLNITGSLDTTTRKATLRIHGKTYF